MESKVGLTGNRKGWTRFFNHIAMKDQDSGWKLSVVYDQILYGYS